MLVLWTFPPFVALSHPVGRANCDKSEGRATARATSMRQPDLRGLAKKVSERQPVVLVADQRRAIIAARDASDISEFPNALRAGALQICCNCSKFTFAADPAAPDQCALLREEVWPFVPFTCGTFTLSKDPVAPQYVPEEARC